MTNDEVIRSKAALLEQYKPATSADLRLAYFHTVTASGKFTEFELSRYRIDGFASLLPAVPPGFKRVLVETSEDPWNRSVSWKVVDQEIHEVETATSGADDGLTWRQRKPLC